VSLVYNRGMTLQELQAKVVAFRDERDWQQFHNPKDLALSLVLESAEVLEHFQWRNGQEIDQRVADNKADIAEELADVLWYLLLLSDGMDINLAEAIQNKLAKNVERYSVDKAKGNHKKYSELAGND
jgi:NTP pyrophosphatase (non-canonical NTP hydrolase)